MFGAAAFIFGSHPEDDVIAAPRVLRRSPGEEQTARGKKSAVQKASR